MEQVAVKSLVAGEKLLISIDAGLTIGEIMDAANLPHDLRGFVVTLNHGLPVRDLDYVTRAGDMITFVAMPQGKGGGQILGAIAMLALAIIAPMVAPIIAGAIGFAGSTLAANVIALGITMVGSLLIQALIPPPKATNQASNSVGSPSQESPTYSLTGQSNQARKYGVIPRIYGKHKFYPNLANTPLIENEGKTSRITAIYDFGYGDILLTDMQIGGLPISTIAPDIRTHTNSLGDNLQLATKDVAYDQLSYKLEKDTPLIVRTKDQAISATLDLTFPRGLVSYDGGGNRQSTAAAFMAWWRPVGTTLWHRVPAINFRGVNVNTENGTWSSYYDGGNYWFSEKFQGGSNKWSQVTIYRDGVIVYQASGDIGWADTIKEVVGANGVRYRIGSGRDSQTVNTKWSWSKSEVQVYEPVVGDATVLSEATGQQIVAAIHIDFGAPGVYEVMVERKSAISTNNTIYNEANLTLIKSFRQGTLIKWDKPHTFIEMSVVASDKINGVVQNLSAICISKLRWHDGISWQQPETTRNPVWICLDILTGTANRKPLRDDQLDMPSWLKLANICDQMVTTTVNGITRTEARYTCDVVVDYRTTVQELISSILSGCRAQMTITASGKYGVLIDEENTVVRQVFTPANSSGFKANRAFVDRPHAFRVKFIDPEIDWQTAEFMVYMDGYNEANATIFEELNTFGTTSYSQAYRFGRYMLAQGIHRSEVFTLSVDVENLAVQRGDLVSIAHDVPRVGGAYARVVSVNGSNVTINQKIDGSPTNYTVRLIDGTVRTGSITAFISESTFTIDNPAGIDYDDLIVVGMFDRTVKNYIVSEIHPGSDLTAELQLVPYVAEIYKVDNEPIPPWSPGFGSDLIGSSDLDVTSLQAVYKIIYENRMPFGQLDLKWITNGRNLDHHTVELVVPGVGTFSIGDPTDQNLQYLIDLLKRGDIAGKPATVKVTPVSKLGNQGKPASVNVTLDRDTKKPLAPQNFAVNVQSEIVEMFWDIPTDKDVLFYDIRYTPETMYPSWNASQHLSRISWQTNHTSAGARTGTYMIRATDSSGNQSDIAMQRTTVETLPNINVVRNIDESTATPVAWPGILSGMVKVGNTIMSAGNWGSVNPTGIYAMSAVVDIGEVYECRVVSMIQAYGASRDDFMSNWVPNLLVLSTGLTRATSEQWDAHVEVRVSSGSTYMSDWLPNLAAIDPIGGTAKGWGDWRPVQVGDFTGRFFQFRIVAKSFDPFVKVVVKSGLVQIDMPDRIWSKSDVAIQASGTTINFDPAFMQPPVISVTVDGNADFLVPEITAKTARSVTVRLLKPGSPVTPSAGQIDIMAKGYGRLRSAPI